MLIIASSKITDAGALPICLEPTPIKKNATLDFAMLMLEDIKLTLCICYV